jgi:hypothetical protein
MSIPLRRRRETIESTGVRVSRAACGASEGCGTSRWRFGRRGIPCIDPVVYHGGMIDGTVIRSRYEAMRPRLDERGRRLFCAAEARSVGYGGVSVVARATGIARCTINRGLKDLKSLDPAPSKLRRPGGGRPALTQTRSYVTGRLARPAGVDDAGRPYATAAVGVQEPCEARARVARHGTSGLGEPDTATAGTSGLPHRSGTRSNIACSVTSRKTGGVGL